MYRPLVLSATLASAVLSLSFACSGDFDPTSASFRPPGQASGPGQGSPAAEEGPTLTPQVSGTTVRLQAVSPVNSNVVWASGLGGTFVVTTDGGSSWRAGVVPGAEQLEFRDVEGVSPTVAYLLAAGEGDKSRIYKTTDGGGSWSLQFTNADSAGFYDCFDFWDLDHGLTFADAVGGRFPVIQTGNGRAWQDIGDRLPVPQEGEAGFAASGTCIATQSNRWAWIGTGGSARARVLATTDAGNSWTAFETPIRQGTGTAGIFTVAFRDRFHGLIAGGDLADSTEIARNNLARTNDAGRTWSLTASPVPITGAVFGLSYVPGHQPLLAVATGPSGTAWSADEGDTWSLIPGVTGFWAVAFASPTAGWLVGTEGKILKLSF